MTIFNITACLILFLIVPYLVGGLAAFFLPKEDSLPFRLLSGYVIEFAIFDLLALPGIWLKASLHLIVILYAVILAACMAVSLAWHKKNTLVILKGVFGIFRAFRKNALLIVVMVLILLQTIFVVTYQHIDDDDAFYVASAETSVATNTLMEIDPYTGDAYETLPRRYVFSPFMSWTATVSVLTGMKPVVMAHMVFPAVFVPLFYMVYGLFAELLKKKRTELHTGIFLLLVFVITSFSNYSTHSQGRVLLTRVWQGKALLASVLLPAILWYALTFFQKGVRKRDYIWFFILMTACCLVSQMGIMLGAVALGIMFLIYSWVNRSIKPMIGCFCCCLCNMICAAGYILMK